MHTRQLVAATAMLVLLAAPASAQDTSNTVAFNGIGFTFDAILGSSVDVTTVPASSEDAKFAPIWWGEPGPRHVTYTLYGSKAEYARPPRVGDADTTVRVYRVSDLAGHTSAAQQATDLAALLAARPDLAATEVVGPNGAEPLPYLPAISVPTAVHARGAYVDVPGLSGITYVTAFTMEIAPFLRNDFQYTFQGLTTDGQWYISVVAIVDTALFPKKLSPKLMKEATVKRWPAYLTKSIATLDGAQPDDFTPSLDTIDALIASITVEGVPASEPGPVVSPAPSVAPAASVAPVASPAPSTAPAASVAPAASPVASASPAA